MHNKDCEFAQGGYCMCDACQSMRKMLEELAGLKGEDIIEKEKAKKIFEEMKASLSLGEKPAKEVLESARK